MLYMYVIYVYVCCICLPRIAALVDREAIMATLSCAMVGPMDGINLLNKVNVHLNLFLPDTRMQRHIPP